MEREYAVRVFGEVDDAKRNQLPQRCSAGRWSGLIPFAEIQRGKVSTSGLTSPDRRPQPRSPSDGKRSVQVSRLIRVRYGDIDLLDRLPRGGWAGTEPENQPSACTGGLPAETTTKVSGCGK